MVLRAVEKEGGVYHETKRKSEVRTHRPSLRVVRCNLGKDKGPWAKEGFTFLWKGKELICSEGKRRGGHWR